METVEETAIETEFAIEEESSSGLPTALKWLPTQLLKLCRIAATQT